MSLVLQDPRLLKSDAYINGEWVKCETGDTTPVTNPATGERVAEVARCAGREAKTAVGAASEALSAWQSRTAKDRAGKLRAWFDLIMEHQEDLAKILTAEQGKPLAEARGEIAYGANYIEWFAEEAKRIYGDIIPQPANDSRLLVIKQAIGVVACITPWNFPCAMLTRKIAPALAAGCTVVCKPASATPLSAFALAELASRAGIPKGVINILAGNTSEIGEEFTRNPSVRKLTFTGSTDVGKKLMAQCADTVKRTSMELGGNAPFIVFDDADLDAAVQGALVSKYRNAGQTCVCSNRFLVQAGVYDAFSKKLIDAVGQFSLGDGSREGISMGPLIDEGAAKAVCSMIDDAVKEGAKIEIGGGYSKLGGSYVEPTVLTEATSEMRVFREEIFGPVAPLFRFETEAGAIQMANDTEFGLAAYFYTKDMSRIWRLSEGLEYGIVGVNTGVISNEMAPFGGVKESGNGREGSKYGIDDYLEIKYICLAGIDQ